MDKPRPSIRFLLGIILAVALWPSFAVAQSDATLIADRITSQRTGILTAEGNVEVFYDGRRLRATRVVYDSQSDSIELTGPILLVDTDGTILAAESAELSSDLRDGILRSARMVLDQQLQIAAQEIHRVDERYVQALRTVSSACQVCDDNPTPLWQIRASRIIHDKDEKQLYYENAVLDIAGFPVAYVPRLRLPDGSLRRSTGFLVPVYRISDRVGTQITLPYFIRLGESSDLTFSPSFTTNDSFTLGGQYRRAFSFGEVQLDFAYTTDQLVAGHRGFIRGLGRFDLPLGFELNLDLEDVSDGGYYRDYGLPETDRIDSTAQISRVRRNELVSIDGVYYTSLRSADSNNTSARRVGEAVYIRRFRPNLIGGIAELRFSAQGHARPSDTDVTGRDMARLGFEGSWQRSEVFRNGIVATGMIGVSGDYHIVQQDSTSPGDASRLVPRAGVELRLPMIRRTANANHLLEPIVQVLWSGQDPRAVPNEYSLLNEFDEGNLFTFDRFAGHDRVEQGLRANLGLRWTRHSESGWKLGAIVGRVASIDPHPDFAVSTGMQDQLSDWLTSLRLDLPSGLNVTARTQTQTNLLVNKAAVRFGLARGKLDMSGTYTWLRPDAAIGRPFETSEFTASANYGLFGDFKIRADWQYDLSAEATRSDRLGVSYQNECLTFDLSLSRSYTTSGNVAPSTSYGLLIQLDGFGTNRPTSAQRRQCRG